MIANYDPVKIPYDYFEKITEKFNRLEFLLSILLDQCLFNWRAFLDLYMKYIIFFVCKKEIVNISTRKFFKCYLNS